MRIAVDAMGGDYAPRVAVQGALLAALEDDVSILLVGDRAQVEHELEQLGGSCENIELVHAPETIGMDEPGTAVRRKRRSSIHVCAELVRDGHAAAMVTAGNSGAAMVAAKLLIGTVPGVDRPALAAVFPNRRGRTLVLDVGANVDSRPEHLRQFAVMGHIYSCEVIGVARPRIGLLSIGEEHVKGNDMVRDAHFALAGLAERGLEFIGNVEGGDVFTGAVDVVVCDGFTGNVLLKASEGMAELVVGMVREELLRNPRTRMGGWLARPAFANFARRTDYAEYGAVPLLGVDGGCFIGHGRSNSRAIRSAVQRAVEFGAADVAVRLRAMLSQLAAVDSLAEPGIPADAGA